MQVKISPDQLQTVVQQMLKEIPQKCDNAIDKAEATVSKKAVQELKATSPKGNGPQGGRYAKGWGVKKTKETTIIYNKTDGQLTHLLEHGHDIIRGGKKVGHAGARPHIKAVEEMVKEEMVEEVEKELGNL